MKVGDNSQQLYASQRQSYQISTERHYLKYKKRRSTFNKKDRISFSLMRQDFRHNNKSLFLNNPISREQDKNQKRSYINIFKRNYQSYIFIFNSNKLRFCFILGGFALSVGILLYLYEQFSMLPLHLQNMSLLEQFRVILLKKQAEILSNSANLFPAQTLSETILNLMNVVNKITESNKMANYSQQFYSILSKDSCGQVPFNCSLLSRDKHKYGLKVIAQYIQEYFRIRNKTALTKKQFTKRTYSLFLALFAKLIKGFISASHQDCVGINNDEQNIFILGSIGVLMGLLMTHYSLRQFKKRIENSRNLLQNIPPQVKSRQIEQAQMMALKEISYS